MEPPSDGGVTWETEDYVPATYTPFARANQISSSPWSPLFFREGSTNSSNDISVSFPWLTFQAILTDISSRILLLA
jgi:hypothetical protein